jgi:hypothetical protein
MISDVHENGKFTAKNSKKHQIANKYIKRLGGDKKHQNQTK